MGRLYKRPTKSLSLDPAPSEPSSHQHLHAAKTPFVKAVNHAETNPLNLLQTLIACFMTCGSSMGRLSELVA